MLTTLWTVWCIYVCQVIRNALVVDWHVPMDSRIVPVIHTNTVGGIRTNQKQQKCYVLTHISTHEKGRGYGYA